jgi:hypothetical protein
MKLFSKSNKLKIIDDDGIIAVVNPDKYNLNLEYREKWTSREFKDFLLKTNKGNLIIWGTGLEAEWTIEVVTKPTGKSAFRQFEQFIEVSNEQLILATFSDIMMTLQFEDKKLPSGDNQKLIIPLDNGIYRMTVKQLFDPEDYDYNPNRKINFELFFERQNEIKSQNIDNIIWHYEEGFGEDDDVFLSNERNEFDDFLEQLVAEGLEKR